MARQTTRREDQPAGPPMIEGRPQNGSKTVFHGRLRRDGYSKARAGRCVLRAWRAEDVWVVRRFRFFRNDELLYGHDAHSGPTRLPGDRRGGLRWPGSNSGFTHPNRGVRHHRQYAGSDCDRPQPIWVFHELERHAERRGLRVSPASARYHRLPDDSRGRRIFDRSRDRDRLVRAHSATRPHPLRSMKVHVDAARLWLVLARCHRALSQIAEHSIEEAGLCLTDFAALEALLHKGPLTITEIQGKVLLASGSMTAAIDRLEKKGLILRSPAPSDRRAKVLELTLEGRRVIETAFRRHATELESAIAILSQGEKRRLYALLKKLGVFAFAAGAGAPG